MKHFWTFFLILFSFGANAQVLRGTVSDTDGNSLAFASIYLENSTLGVTTDLKGRYFFEIPLGNHTCMFSYIGYKTKKLNVAAEKNETLVIDVVLESAAHQMQAVEVVADTRDRGTQIMKNAIAQRSLFNKRVTDYSCKTYVKTSLEKVLAQVEEGDSAVVTHEVIEAANLQQHFGKESLNLIESVSTTYFGAPRRFKEVVEAYHDYAKGPANANVGRSSSISFSADVGKDFGDIAPKKQISKNPYLLYEGISSSTINFYENYIDFPAATQQPLLSPLASTALINYKFYFDGSFYEDENKINRIRVKPRFPTESLFEGIVFIDDVSHALLGVDLNIVAPALLFCEDFNIIQNYEEVKPGIYLPTRREMVYSIKEGNNFIIGNTRVDHKNYDLTREFDNAFFGGEIKRFEVEAFDKDSSYWSNNRTLTLTADELQYIHKSDSISDYYSSDTYFHKLDSAFNRFDWWTPLVGYGHRNRERGNELYIEGILGQINPVGIGGYRHRLPGHFYKTFKNGKKLSNDVYIDYGFKNQDIKGKITTGFTFIPEKFVKTSVKLGDYYELINSYASLEQTFSRSNYVRNKTFGIAQSMEILNGLYAELSFEYSDQKAINDLQLSSWSNTIFGELNKPISFERYVKSELVFKAKYRFNQKYVMRGKQKIIIGTDYPELNFTYKKGLPGVFGSEVNFDYLELQINDDIQLARLGYSNWSASIGTYLNKANLRVLEHKFFRGSDQWFFSNPVYSLQLLGPTLHTPNEWFQANYIHHFEGSLLSKVPLVRKLKLQLAAGGGTLLIPDSDFAHGELFVGLEKTIRIKQQLFRLSAFGVTADSSFDTAQIRLKVGIGFYNTFTQKWDY